MISSSPLESHYLSLVLLKQFDEAFLFAKNNNVDIFCDNNYIMSKIINLDQVDILNYLKGEGQLDKIKDIILPASNFGCHSIKARAENCLNWLIEEKVILTSHNHSSEALCDLILRIIASKISVLNRSSLMGADGIKLINSMTQKLVEYVFPPINRTTVKNFPSILEIIDQGIMLPTKASSAYENNNHYKYNQKITKDYLLPIIESYLLYQEIKNSCDTAFPPAFKV